MNSRPGWSEAMSKFDAEPGVWYAYAPRPTPVRSRSRMREIGRSGSAEPTLTFSHEDRPVGGFDRRRLVFAEIHAIAVIPEREAEVVQYRPGFMTDSAAHAVLARECRHRRRGTWRREYHRRDPERESHDAADAH